MTKVHAYLARIKDQEKEVIAVPDGAGRALCVSSDKHWTLTREWDELHIIAPLVEDEGNDDKLERLRKALAGSRDAHQRTVQAHETMKRAFDLSQERVLELKRELNAAAEARTAPAVTKRELRSVVGAHDPGDDELAVSRVNAFTDRLWSLVSGADPAVFVVRESDIAAVKVEQDEDGGWEANGDFIAMRQNTAEALRGWSLGELQMLARYEAVARAIEAEQAVDPVEARADELYEMAYGDLPPGIVLPDTVRMVCRTIAEAEARQEDRHVDQ